MLCRPEEGKGGDSVTRLHVDLSDAVNITLHVQRGPQEAPTTVRCGSQAADAKKDPRHAHSLPALAGLCTVQHCLIS